MDEVLKHIIDFADQAHGSQMRKYASEKYIHHPIRVMHTVSEHTSAIAVLAAALLHDVLEDTPVTEPEMRSFLARYLSPADVNLAMTLIIDLTDVYIKKDYPHLRRRARKAKEVERLRSTRPEAHTIKYADIIDNTNDVVKADPDFARVLLREYKNVLKQLDKGVPALYEQALRAVDDGIRQADK